jgi:EmrB/QacA subfamily drug resistance transporter
MTSPLLSRGRSSMDQRVAVSVVYLGALFLNIMDVTIVNVTLPSIGRGFHSTATSVDVVVISYLVSLAVFIPASGWVGDRFGDKRSLLAAIGIFTLASALCGVSGSLGELVVFRVLQGAGGGLLTPVGMAMLYRTFPPAERMRVASILLAPTALAPAAGPLLGGLLVTDLSWRWAFYVNLPIGIGAFVFGLVFVTEKRELRPGAFDLVGFLLAGGGLGALMFGVSEGPEKGWGSPDVCGLLALGLSLLVAMVVVEQRKAHPMVDLRLFSDRLFRISNELVGLTMISFFGTLYVVPLYYQDGRGLSALDSGLDTFPEAIGVLIGIQVVSRVLYPRLGPRRVMTGGLIGVAICAGSMSLCGPGSNLWWMRILLVGIGYSIPHVMVSMQTAAFATISPTATGRASTLFNANRQVGSAAGVALLSTVISAIGPLRQEAGRPVAYLSAYDAAFLVAAFVALAGAAIAFVSIRDSDAASTRRMPTRPNR